MSDEQQQRFFPCEPIRRVEANDPTLDSLLKRSEPLVITHSQLIPESTRLKWSSLDYLRSHLGTRGEYTVLRSSSQRFLYWDDKKLDNAEKDFVRPTETLQLKFGDFCNIIDAWQPSDNEYYYLQQPLNSSVDQQIMADFRGFNWRWACERQKSQQWCELTSNMLLVGQPGNLTPAHYDEQENLFAQVRGRKRCTLFAPDSFERLCPYPIWHPCDRQAMADLTRPDFERFPKLKELKGVECVLEPSEVLYIPAYWFHEILAVPDNENDTQQRQQLNVSVNFWYRAAAVDKREITYPLRADQKLAVMRNIEKMVTQALADPREVGPFFRALTLGRYTN